MEIAPISGRFAYAVGGVALWENTRAETAAALRQAFASIRRQPLEETEWPLNGAEHESTTDSARQRPTGRSAA